MSAFNPHIPPMIMYEYPLKYLESKEPKKKRRESLAMSNCATKLTISSYSVNSV
jgi:hypothetical protein